MCGRHRLLLAWASFCFPRRGDDGVVVGGFFLGEEDRLEADAAGARRALGTTEQGFELRGFEEREPYAVHMLMKMPRGRPREEGACEGEVAS